MCVSHYVFGGSLLVPNDGDVIERNDAEGGEEQFFEMLRNELGHSLICARCTSAQETRLQLPFGRSRQESDLRLVCCIAHSCE